MYRMGFDTTGHLLHMNKATAAGIHAVFQPMPAERAVVNTGAIISATTTGLMPLKMAESVGLLVISSGVRNIAMSRIMRKLGMMVPSDDIILPLSPRSLSPTTTEAVQAVMYYIDDAIQFNSSRVRILHGTGTGALRQCIRQYLGTVSAVSTYHDEDVRFGGPGITVVEF